MSRLLLPAIVAFAYAALAPVAGVRVADLLQDRCQTSLAGEERVLAYVAWPLYTAIAWSAKNDC